MTQAKFKIYLAGPDVFFADAKERFAALEAECEMLGLVGLRPADGGALARNSALANPAPGDIARQI